MSDTLTFDQKIDKLLATVQAQRADVQAAEALTKRSWETNCSFQSDGARTPVNIQTANIPTLHALMTGLVLEQGAAGEAAGLLGIEPQPLRSGGYTFEQWTADFKKRVAIITLTEKRRKLDEQEERLNKLISPEKRREMELAALEAELNG